MNISAYEGNQPYIFISYAHKDTDTVLPIIESLIASGFRVWYDAGIEKGSHWNDNIANHLENCTIFIPLISKAFCESKYCQMELHHACVKDKDPLPIYLENVDLSAVSRGNDMWISQFQKIFYYETSWEDFIKELIANPLLAPCTGNGGQRSVGFSTVKPTYTASSDFKIEKKVLIKYEGYDEDVTIPYGVTEIGEKAFSRHKTLTSITIPNSVTSIGIEAFAYCERLTSITIPNSVTSIGSEAFRGCSSLTSITIPDSVIRIDDKAFYYCWNLTHVILGKNLKKIGLYAFSECAKLQRIFIPNSVKVIESRAFFNTPKVTIYCEASSKQIGWEYGWNCIAVLESDGVLPTKWGCVLTQGQEQDNFVMVNHVLEGYLGNSSQVYIPAGVTSISSSAFSGCTSITSITIPDSVTDICKEAFKSCTKLTGVYITDLAKWCVIDFATGDANPLTNARKLYLNNQLVTDLVIPDSVTSIGNFAFFKCTSLKSITIPDTVQNIGASAFAYCASLTSVTLPDSAFSIPLGAFAACTSLTNITIPDSVTSIGTYAFLACTSLTSVKVGNSVTSIDREAFENCRALTNIMIPNSVTSIDYRAFYGCSNLTNIMGGKGLKDIDGCAFENCPNLKKKPKVGGGCYVATCVYGSYDCPEVWTLRRYRDELLGASWHGRMFIRLYYAVSPTLVKWFGHTRWFKKLFKKRLDKMVQKLQNEGFDSTPYEDKTW